VLNQVLRLQPLKPDRQLHSHESVGNESSTNHASKYNARIYEAT
jgi:hypothetical protein